MSLIPLSDIVKNVKLAPLFQDEEYDYVLQWAILGVRQLSKETGQIRSVVLEVDTGCNVVALPNDFVRHSKVGVLINGVIRTMARNNRLATVKNMCTCTNPDPCSETSTCTNCNKSVYGYRNFNLDPSRGGSLGGVFGFGPTDNLFGEYEIDRQNHQIQFSSDMAYDCIVLEYVSNGMPDDLDGEFQVLELMRMSLINYVKWNILQNRPNAHVSRIQMFQDQYRKDAKEFSRITGRYTLQELWDTVVSNQFQAAKT